MKYLVKNFNNKKLKEIMKTSNYIYLFIAIITILIIGSNNIFAQGSGNNAFVFNGLNSRLYILDGQPVNSSANQDGFKYFNKSGSTNRTITVQAWIYLIGESPNVKMPIIYRSVNPSGTSFSLYVQNQKGYFTVGNSAPVSTTVLPAFQWVQLTGIYDGTNLKIYLNNDLSQSSTASLGDPYTNGIGLFIGKSAEGAFKGLIDEIRMFNTPIGENNINGSGGNGNPAEKFPSSLSRYSVGEWSFTEISNNTYLADLSTYLNHLRVENINQIVPSKKPGLLVVNSLGDSPDTNPGDGIADAGNGTITLRSAIQEANALAGPQPIYFYIPGSGPFNIVPGSALPAISDQVILDGTTQHGYAGIPLVKTSGNYGGLTVTAGNCTVQALSLNSSSGYGLTLSSGSGNIISNNQVSGISVSSSANSINGNIITGSTVNGISIVAGGSNNQIGVSSANNIFGNTGYGMTITSANGNQISFNSFTNNGLGGINLSNSAATIIGNTITGNSGVGLSANGSTGNAITNNTIANNNAGGIILNNISGSVSGNSISGNSGIGLSLISANNNTVSGNTISVNQSHGLSINGNNNNVNNNIISGNTGFGISVTAGTGNQLTNNKIGTNNEGGTANILGGISLANTTANLTGNIVTGNSGNGVSLTTSNGNTLFQNTISGNSKNGLVINGNNNSLNGNSITGNSGLGLSDSASTGNQIINNTIGTNTLGGIYLNNSTVNLSGNTVSGNLSFGITLSASSGNTLSGNTISGNSSNGLIISGDNNSLDNNNVNGNSGYGILINNSSANQITNNAVGTNVLGGISLINSTGNLTGNIINANSDFGISLDNVNSITVSDNIVSGNARHGIIINGNRNIIVNDSVFNNGNSGTGAGVFIESGNNNSILNNSIYNNSVLGIELSTSANDSQSYPTLTTLYTWQDETALPNIKGGSAIQGTLNSTPGKDFKIQFFANANTTNREGKRYLGESDVTTDLAGEADFLVNLKDAVLSDGEVVSATATKLDGSGNPLSTSEFSASVARETDEGLHYKVNTTLAGIPLHWKNGNSKYQIAQSVINKGFESQVQNGFNTWNTLTQLNYTQRFAANSEHWGGNADGINNVVWFPTTSEWEDSTEAPTNVLAVTRVRYNSLNGEITDADIAINGQPVSLNGFGQFYWSTTGDIDKVDVQNTATHEIGHYSGLADLYNPGDFLYTLDMKNNNQGATMYGRIDVGELSKRDLHPISYTNQADVTNYDIGGINYIYNNLDSVYYDIVLVFDGSANFISPVVLNGFVPSKNAAAQLTSNLRMGDKIGWVNGKNEIHSLGSNFNQLITDLGQLQPNPSNTTTGNLADRITAAENLLAVIFHQ